MDSYMAYHVRVKGHRHLVWPLDESQGPSHLHGCNSFGSYVKWPSNHIVKCWDYALHPNFLRVNHTINHIHLICRMLCDTTNCLHIFHWCAQCPCDENNDWLWPSGGFGLQSLASQLGPTMCQYFICDLYQVGVVPSTLSFLMYSCTSNALRKCHVVQRIVLQSFKWCA